MGTNLLGPALAVALSLTSAAHAADPVVIVLPVPPAPTTSAAPPAPAPPPAPVVIRPPKPDPWKAYPLALEAQAALAGPLGGLGVALDLSLVSVLAINAGIGAGFGGPFSDPQLAITPRLRIPYLDSNGLRAAIGIEAGLSRGGHTEVFGCFLKSDCVNKSWEWVVWQNTNLDLEARIDHFQFRFFLGRGTPIASRGRAYCESARDGGQCTEAARRLPSAVANIGLVFGYAF